MRDTHGKYKRNLIVFGELFDIACAQAEMSWAEVAQATGTNKATISKACRGKIRPQRDIVLKWCAVLRCGPDLEEALLNSVGHASTRQEEAATRFLEELKQREEN
jgi:transcriptional regulator with XRE-family HTH domain